MDQTAALASFLASLDARGAAQTRDRYERACRTLMEQLGERPLAQVGRTDIQRALARLHAGGWSPRTLAVSLSAWRSWFRHLAKSGAADPAVFAGVKAPRAAKRLPNALTEGEAMRLVDAPRGDRGDASPALLARDQAMFELLYGCGIRIGELVGINVVDADVARGELRVFGKGRKQRLLPLGGPACAALQQWLALRPTLRAAAQDAINASDACDATEATRAGEAAMFLGARGERVSAPVVRRALRARALQQGLTTPVYPHRLRHSFASHVLQSSQDLRAVQELMGHASIASTQVYTHLDFQHLAKVYDQAHPRARRPKD